MTTPLVSPVARRSADDRTAIDNRLRWLTGPSLMLLLMLSSAGEVRALGVTVALRPLHLHVPPSYTGTTPVPLVILLHGMGATSTLQEVYMRVAEQADRRGFIYAYPDGLRRPDVLGSVGGPFWNGANCCQDPFTRPIDDVAYIDAIIDYVRHAYRLDERRIFIIGHSNGAFMASRYACERRQVAAIVTLGGGQYENPLQCGTGEINPFSLNPLCPPFVPTPVPCRGAGATAVLHIHGTADLITPYWSSWTVVLPFGSNLPSASETVRSWMYRNGCALPAIPLPDIDLVEDVPGAETSRSVFSCTGAALEFWTMNGSPHVPKFFQSPATATFGAQAVDWLLAHGRP